MALVPFMEARTILTYTLAEVCRPWIDMLKKEFGVSTLILRVHPKYTQTNSVDFERSEIEIEIDTSTPKVNLIPPTVDARNIALNL